ncbi:MAG TPA: hypothetical protein VJJ26_02660 [Candidatus Babeliales bacterium]|nr:hypothetical protein [Candidatus Babeliales bacterium]
MKLFNNNHDKHNHTEQSSVIERVTKKIREYWNNMYCSDKCKKMSRGSCDIVRAMSWPRGENWRRTHPKSLNKSHKH